MTRTDEPTIDQDPATPGATQPPAGGTADGRIVPPGDTALGGASSAGSGGGTGKRAADPRAERLAAALRANLARRKAAARSTAAARADDAAGEGGD